MIEEEDANPLALQVQMCFPLYAATRLVVQAYRPLLEELGLTYPQYLVMLALWDRDGLSVRELGAKLLLDSGTLTPLLKRMEKRGLVERRRDPADERMRLTWLTPEGRDLRARAVSIPGDLMVAAGLSLEEVGHVREVVRGMLEKLVDFHGMAFDDSTDSCP